MITSPSLSTAGVTSFLGLRPGFGLAGMTHSLDATIRRLIRNGSVRSHQPSQGINSTYQSPIKWRKKKRQQRQRRWWWWKVHSFERGVEVEQQRRVTGADGELKRGGFLSYGKKRAGSMEEDEKAVNRLLSSTGGRKQDLLECVGCLIR